MLNLDIRISDPLQILKTTKGVLEHAKFILLNPDALPAAAERVSARYTQGLGTATEAVGATGNLETDIQRVFVQDAVNFSFWPRPDEAKWRVAAERGEVTGWHGIVACVSSAIREGVPILDANYLANISLADVENLFRGEDETALPMLSERAAALREAGSVLRKEFGGAFVNALRTAQYDAIKLVQLIIQRFPLFRDWTMLDGHKVVFLKRAQIAANDLNYVLSTSATPLASMNELTAFADYKLPQALRHLGVLQYADDLASRIDAFVEIPASSREEIEIRAATIWAVEFLRQRLETLTAGEIDNALWLLGRDLAHDMRPHHRTRTIWY